MQFHQLKRRQFITLLGGAAAWPLAARAQQAGKIRAIGLLSPASRSPSVVPALFDALAELGWIEGKNLVVERRYAENRLERLPELAAELVRLNVEVIVANGTLGPLAAKRATSTIPIVMTAAGDPLGSGPDVGDPGSIPGGARPGRLRWRIRHGEKAAPGCVDHGRRPSHRFPSKAHCGLRDRAAIAVA